KLDQMIVTLILKIWSPAIVNPRPATSSKKYVQKFITLVSIQTTACKQLVSTQYIFVFRQQRHAHQRSQLFFQACGNHRTASSLPEAGANKHIGVNNNFHAKYGSTIATILPDKNPRPAAGQRPIF